MAPHERKYCRIRLLAMSVFTLHYCTKVPFSHATASKTLTNSDRKNDISYRPGNIPHEMKTDSLADSDVLPQRQLYQSGGTSCWRSAFENLKGGDALEANDASSQRLTSCHNIGLMERQELALRLTSCQMSVGGRPLDLDMILHCAATHRNSKGNGVSHNKDEISETDKLNTVILTPKSTPRSEIGLSSCLTPLQFQIYTQFYLSIQSNLCHQLYRQSLTHQLEEASRRGSESIGELKNGMSSLLYQMESFEGHQKLSIERIEEAQDRQRKSQSSLNHLFADLSSQLNSMYQANESMKGTWEHIKSWLDFAFSKTSIAEKFIISQITWSLIMWKAFASFIAVYTLFSVLFRKVRRQALCLWFILTLSEACLFVAFIQELLSFDAVELVWRVLNVALILAVSYSIFYEMIIPRFARRTYRPDEGPANSRNETQIVLDQLTRKFEYINAQIEQQLSCDEFPAARLTLGENQHQTPGVLAESGPKRRIRRQVSTPNRHQNHTPVGRQRPRRQIHDQTNYQLNQYPIIPRIHKSTTLTPEAAQSRRYDSSAAMLNVVAESGAAESGASMEISMDTREDEVRFFNADSPNVTTPPLTNDCESGTRSKTRRRRKRTHSVTKQNLESSATNADERTRQKRQKI